MTITSELEFYLLGREDQRTGGHTMFDPPDGRDHRAYKRGRKDEARPITVHVAAVEYSDEVDTTVHVAATLDDLHREIRASIETEVLDMIVPEWRPEVYEYVARRRGDGSEWEDWHGELHEIDGTPWVTIEEKEI